jgi:hypothetical protein
MNNVKSKALEVLGLRTFPKLSLYATVLAALSSSQSGRNMQPIAHLCLFLRLTMRGAYLQFPIHLHDVMYNRTQA